MRRELGALIFTLLLLTRLSAIPELSAQERQSNPDTDVRLVHNMSRIAEGEPFPVVVDIAPPSGWHTYWVNPGESGRETRFRIGEESRFRIVETRWPPPTVFEFMELISFGYERVRPVLYLVATDIPAEAPREAALVLEVDFLVCREVCLMEQARVGETFRLSEEPRERLLRSATVRNALAELPTPWSGNIEVSASNQPTALELSLTETGATPEHRRALSRAGVVVEGTPEERVVYPKTRGIFSYDEPPTAQYEDGRATFLLPIADDMKLREALEENRLSFEAIVRLGTTWVELDYGR